MGFRGYTLSLCEKGHVIQGNPFHNFPKKCRECSSKIVLNKIFSTTNEDEYEEEQNSQKRKEIEQKQKEILKMNETKWNEFLNRIKWEYKSLNEELNDPDTEDYNDVIQDDLESLRDEYEIMSQQYSKECGIDNIPSFEELIGKE